MEYIDTYDENKNFVGTYSRSHVHENALWHNTVHCWIYDKCGNIYFQIRKEENKFYTTASGHVLAGENLKEAFGREIKEEIGINIEYNNANLVNIYIFKLDKVKDNGEVFRDRAFSNIYVYEFDGNIEDFIFQTEEINGLVKLNAASVIKLFNDEFSEISATIITNDGYKNIESTKNVSKEDFLLNKHETLLGKYGDVLNKVVELTTK
ncbi:MAG: NUDIX domain-containing protein [Clostridia bacterium]|nr:NUDIX domain-containing protein [Clostridia bacterium]